MHKPLYKILAVLVVSGLLSGPAVAEALGEDELQSIRQYCDEMNGFGAYATEEERLRAVNLCIDDEVSRATRPDETDTPERSD